MSKFDEIKFTQKIESNQLFFILPADVLAKLQEKYFFYVWNDARNEARLVTSWDTTDEDIDSFIATLDQIMRSR